MKKPRAKRNNKKRATIYVPPGDSAGLSLLARGEAKAKRWGVSFSKYVVTLIARDLKTNGPVVLEPTDDAVNGTLGDVAGGDQ